MRLTIETTTYCNFKCLFCPRERYALKDKVMSMELFKKVIDSIYDMKLPIDSICLNNIGEPLLDSYLIERINYAKKLSNNISIYTNGALLTEEKMRELEPLLHNIWLSIHGNTPEEYERIMVGGNFEQIKKITKLAKEIFKDKLWIYNCPKGDIEPYLDVKVCKEANQPFFSWAHDETIMKNMNTKIYSHPFCEIAGGRDSILIRVDGSIMSCCMDWRKENNLIKGEFPMCINCNMKYVFDDALKSGQLARKVYLMRELNDKINNS